MDPYIKLLLVGPLVLFLGWVASMIYHGRLHRKTSCAVALGHHKDSVGMTAWAGVILVFALEMVLRKHPMLVSPAIKWVHVPLAVATLGFFLAIALRFNGEEAPSIHSKLVYMWLTPLFAATLATGGFMLWQL